MHRKPLDIWGGLFVLRGCGAVTVRAPKAVQASWVSYGKWVPGSSRLTIRIIVHS